MTARKANTMSNMSSVKQAAKEAGERAQEAGHRAANAAARNVGMIPTPWDRSVCVCVCVCAGEQAHAETRSAEQRPTGNYHRTAGEAASVLILSSAQRVSACSCSACAMRR